MNETVYALYKIARNIVERAEKCCDKDHTGEETFEYFKKGVAFFDASDKGYAERYEKEKKDE
jgi:hypothetical protein